jgi:tRNA nucleotidyltransferase/poly(A) polymerase
MKRTIKLPKTEFSILKEVLHYLEPDENKEVWLVGGSLRDLVAGKNNLPDLDLAVSFNPLGIADKYARRKKAGFVVLDSERQVVRLVKTIDSKHYTIDIARFRAEDICADLEARDFTINAMAARLNRDLKSPELVLFDPLNGYDHLQKKLVIPCSDSLFKDDPLRIMRAFRFAALFDADIASELLDKIKKESGLLENVSGERIRDEFFKVLSIPFSARWIKIMSETGVLEKFLPELDACKGVEQNEWHHLDVFDHTILTLENLEKLINLKDYDCVSTLRLPSARATLNDHFKEWWPEFLDYLDESITPGRSICQALKFGCLLHDIGKPSCKKLNHENQRIVFHGHEMEGVELSKTIIERLRLSGNEKNFLAKVIKNHMRPGVILQQGVSDKRLFKFYTETGRDGLAVSLLSLADRYSALGSMSEEDLNEFTCGIFAIMDEFYQQMKKPKRPPLLSGKDLIKEFNLKPGPNFREILEAVAQEQYTGLLEDREQALEFVRKNFLQTT